MPFKREVSSFTPLLWLSSVSPISLRLKRTPKVSHWLWVSTWSGPHCFPALSYYSSLPLPSSHTGLLVKDKLHSYLRALKPAVPSAYDVFPQISLAWSLTSFRPWLKLSPHQRPSLILHQEAVPQAPLSLGHFTLLLFFWVHITKWTLFTYSPVCFNLVFHFLFLRFYPSVYNPWEQGLFLFCLVLYYCFV